MLRAVSFLLRIQDAPNSLLSSWKECWDSTSTFDAPIFFRTPANSPFAIKVTVPIYTNAIHNRTKQRLNVLIGCTTEMKSFRLSSEYSESGSLHFLFLLPNWQTFTSFFQVQLCNVSCKKKSSSKQINQLLIWSYDSGMLRIPCFVTVTTVTE